ncbi:NAD(P)H-binding protein [Flavobacterium psychrotrophum]|uniref:NAD(P)H-binding protein n=1 Tax=Flavobacterium psychrotrophum TaxID=2294119 RepID=UPI000E31E981|nr:NAD(P)H-binding protein [Flavobacterium psychrotrophum]
MQISVLGCGWLGLPLAEKLTDNYAVKGSVTSPEKVAVLQSKGIVPYIIDLNIPDAAVIADFLSGSDVLIITIPPKVKAEGGLPYPDKVAQLLPFIKGAGIKKVLFTSSISVYADDETIPQIDETTTPNPDTESGKQVLAAEVVLQSCNDFETSVLRLGGLIGAERHPIYHLAGKSGLANPDAPTNLASLDTVLTAMLYVLRHNLWGITALVVNPEHPARALFYTAEAKRLNLPLPQFNHDLPSKGKLILGSKC